MAFPDSFATLRLHAERLRIGHTDDIHRMHQDAEQMAMLGGIRNDAQTALYMTRNLAHWDTYQFGMWVLRDTHDNRVAGRAMLRHLDIGGADEIETGYSLFPEYWGRGLATEIAAACVKHARTALRVPSVVALTRADHIRSQRVMTKIGMVFDCEIEHGGLPHVLFRMNFGDRP
jgi:RimJ/RimL family protein N-acetyltransferase